MAKSPFVATVRGSTATPYRSFWRNQARCHMISILSNIILEAYTGRVGGGGEHAIMGVGSHGRWQQKSKIPRLLPRVTARARACEGTAPAFSRPHWASECQFILRWRCGSITEQSFLFCKSPSPPALQTLAAPVRGSALNRRSVHFELTLTCHVLAIHRNHLLHGHA